MFKFKLLSFTVLGILFSSLASGSPDCTDGWKGDPSHVKITVYAVAVSANQDCSNAKLLSQYPSGEEFDLLQNPTLMQGDMANGSYPCVVLQMSDLLKVTPATSHTCQAGGTGSCTAGVETNQSICRANNGGGQPQKYSPMIIAADGSVTFGAATNCQGDATASPPVTDRVSLFLTTGWQAHGQNVTAFEQPVTANAADCGVTKENCGLLLNNPFVVAGNVSKTFIVNFFQQVDIQGGTCAVEAPVFDFQ